MINHQAIVHSPVFLSILMLQYELLCPMTLHLELSFDLVPLLGVKAGADPWYGWKWALAFNKLGSCGCKKDLQDQDDRKTLNK